MNLFTYTSKQHVELFDCDPMMVVWHGNYLKYMEKARGEFLNLIGYPYLEVARQGYFFPVVDLKIKYKSSLRLNDDFEVNCDLVEYTNRLVHTFTITSQGVVCAEARSVQVALPKDGKELSFFMPQSFISCVEKFLKDHNCPLE